MRSTQYKEFSLKRLRFKWQFLPETPKEGVSADSRVEVFSSLIKNPVLECMRLFYFKRDVATPFPFLCLLCGDPNEKVVL